MEYSIIYIYICIIILKTKIMTKETKETKTLIVLTKAEKEKAARLSKKILGKRNYSGLYAYFLDKLIE